jgi:hypothetical protein
MERADTIGIWNPKSHRFPDIGTLHGFIDTEDGLKMKNRVKMKNILEVYIKYSSKLAETIIGWYNRFTLTGGFN